MFKKVILLSAIFVLGLCVTLRAETAGIPVGCDFPKGPGVITKDRLIDRGLNPIYITGMMEIVLEKKLESTSADNIEMKGQWYLGKTSFAVNEKFQAFMLLGASSLDISADHHNTDGTTTRITSHGDGDFAYGGGFLWQFCEIPDYDISLVFSTLYRESKLSGDIREPSTGASNLRAKAQELQFGLSAYKDLTIWNVPLRPYVSLLAAESEVNLKFNTHSGSVNYDLGTVSNRDNFGIALGCEKEPLKGLVTACEVRFFTELSTTIGLSLKF